MRTIRNIFIAGLPVLILITLGACSKSSTTPSDISSIITFRSTINGAGETPPNGSLATGTASFSFNTATNILSGTVNFEGIIPTLAHIHMEAVGKNGIVAFTLGTQMITSPIRFTSAPLDASQKADLLAELYYVNLHSVAYPNGEIRGQILKNN